MKVAQTVNDWRIAIARSTRLALGISAVVLLVLVLVAVLADALGIFTVPLTNRGLISAAVGGVSIAIGWFLLPWAEKAGYVRELTFVTFMLLGVTITVATVLFGGISSVLPYIYTPIILAVAILLGLRPGVYMATIILFLHAFSAVLELYGYVETVEIWGAPIPTAMNPGIAWTTVIMLGLVFYVIAVVAGALSDLLAETNRNLGKAEETVRQEEIKSKFLERITHELRTPLTSVKGFLHLATSGMIPQEKLPEFLGRISGNVEIITGHVNDLMFLQEVDLVVDRSEAIDLRDIAKDVMANYARKGEESGVKMAIDVPNEMPKIPADYNALLRAFTALVDNAIKYSPDGGRLKVNVAAENGRAHMSVSDTGIGIDEEHLPHIFERFYHIDKTTEHVFGGIGVGLPIAQSLVRAHGGDIYVESKLGEGSKFTLWLPVTSR